MIHSFYKYLILHKQASLPGIGNFFIKRIPASIQSSSNILVSPCYQIIFDKNEASADKHFYTFLQKEIGDDNVNAIIKFNDFTYSLKDELNHKRKIWLPYMGELTINETGELVFSEEKNEVDFYPTLNIEKNIEKVTQKKLFQKPIVDKGIKNSASNNLSAVEEKSTKRNANWWKIALGIAVASIVGILYYYATNNFQ